MSKNFKTFAFVVFNKNTGDPKSNEPQNLEIYIISFFIQKII